MLDGRHEGAFMRGLGDAPSSLRFFGRGAELQRLAGAVKAVERDGFQIVVIDGEAGIGKTKILEAGRHLQDGRYAGTRGTRPPAGPYQELFPILSMLGAEEGAAAVLEEVSALTGSTAAVDLQEVLAKQGAAFARLSRRLLDALAEEPTFLAVDDLHWIHNTTIAFLGYLFDDLLARAGELPLLVAVAHRPLNPSTHSGRFLDHVLRSDRTTLITPTPLSPADQMRFIRALGVEEPSPTFLGLVDRLGGGNPLRTRAALGLLQQRAIPPSVGPDDHRVLGEFLRQIDSIDPVVDWVHELDEDCRRILRCGAALRDEFSVRDLASVGGVDIAAAAAALDRAQQAGLVHTDDVTWWFSHPLVRDVLHQEIGHIERTAIHLRCIAHLRGDGRDDGGDAIRIGHLLLQVGDAVSAQERHDGLRTAAETAYGAGAWSDASRFYEAALASEPRAAGPTAPGTSLRLAAAHAHYFNHDPAAARRRLNEVVAAATILGDRDQYATAAMLLVRVANTTTPEALQTAVDLEPLTRVIEQATDDTTRSLALELMAEVLVMGGRIGEALDASRQAVALVPGCEDERAVTLTYIAHGLACFAAVDLPGARAAFVEAIERSRAIGEWYLQSAAEARLSFVALVEGRLDEADAIGSEALAKGVLHHEFTAQALGGAIRCMVANIRGEFAAGDAAALEAEVALQRSRYMAAAQFLPPARLLAQLQQGDWTAAQGTLEAWSTETRLSHQRHAALLAAYRRGPVPEPATRAPRWPLTVFGGGHAAVAGELILASPPGGVARVTNTGAVIEALGELEARGVAFPPNWPVSVSRVLGELHAAEGRTELATRSLERAIITTRQAGAAPEQCRALIALAAVLHGDGDHDRSRRLAAEAHEQARRLGLPALVKDSALLLRQSFGGLGPTRETSSWCVIMITDVVGSTQVSIERGDESYVGLIGRHHDLVRRCLAANGGTEFADAGDGLWSWFASAEHALAGAQAIQDAVHQERLLDPPLAIKVVLVGGEPHFHRGRPVGVLLNLADRIMDLARAGQILTNEGVAQRAGGTHQVECLGSYELKSIPGRTLIYRAAPHGPPGQDTAPTNEPAV
jgi:class 3 adenylate cyclase